MPAKMFNSSLVPSSDFRFNWTKRRTQKPIKETENNDISQIHIKIVILQL